MFNRRRAFARLLEDRPQLNAGVRSPRTFGVGWRPSSTLSWAGHVTDPFRFPLVQIPSSLQDFERNTEILAEIAEARSAEGFLKRIVREIRAFESSLDPAHEVGIRLVSFGQALTFH